MFSNSISDVLINLFRSSFRFVPIRILLVNAKVGNPKGGLYLYLSMMTMHETWVIIGVPSEFVLPLMVTLPGCEI